MTTRLLQLVDGFKLAPRRLREELDSEPGLRPLVMRTIEEQMRDFDWPKELNSPEAGLLGLLGLQIGAIQNPVLRRKASEEFFQLGAEMGFGAAKLRMICSEAGELERRLEGVTLVRDPVHSEGE
jgi:hypothetical protein